ncbi:DNA polymerase III subunit gamma/tau [Buchnera aphidicola]|uniref:DNA polymerase III subunit gamma/tau n=1 Tax=Buchnera aphidicola subsp. Cinara cedri (strain Cc) TaxID=372461 RepID=Q057E1_BUCCC|nr:DNA polymerase III subunit gamma/tau [Buchnera aphidicola]ABJ90758.1 DNA polymerase III, g and t subunits [Buchnera aphidicola BCc]
MKYKILSNKWRPQNFNQIIGHKYTVKMIKNSLNFKKIHQSWLLSGMHGVGKTTIARILAKCLNCKIGITSIPCRKCKNCLSLEKGKFLDFIELDAASKTKVDDIKIMLDTTKYAPMCGRFKIYLIDEVHMLSKHSFNALLKILEEPPKYIQIYIATTNIHKIPKTIISRCLHIKLSYITLHNIYNFLKKITKKENIKIKKEALKIISNTSQGSIRNALNTLEFIRSSVKNKTEIKKKYIFKLLGILDKKNVLKLAIEIINNDFNKIFNILNNAEKIGIQYSNIVSSLIIFFHKISLIKINQKKKKKYNKISKYKQKVYILSKKISFKDLQFYCKILLQGKHYLNNSPSPKIGFEIMLFQIFQYIKEKK